MKFENWIICLIVIMGIYCISCADIINGMPNKINNSIIIVFDASGCIVENDKIKNAKVAVKNTILSDRITKNDEVALVVFYDCDKIALDQSFTTNKSLVISAIDRIQPFERGTSSIRKANDFAKNYMAENARGVKKRIVLFTCGEDTCEP